MEHEQRDPFAQKEGEDVSTNFSSSSSFGVSVLKFFFSSSFISQFQLSDWDRYAATEYELLVAEESNDGTG